MAKPKQKFEVNFQNDISLQLEQMTKHQLLRLLFAITKLLPISITFLQEYQWEFVNLFKTIGEILGTWTKKEGRSNPGVNDLIESSEIINLEKENPSLNAIFLGLGGKYFDKKLAVNICDDLKKIADPQYEVATTFSTIRSFKV